MERPLPHAPRNERWGPEIYVHLEFRVSWGGKKEQSPKNHQVTYRSRNSRERSPAFPRQVPAPNTNYLAAIHNFDQRQSRFRELRQSAANNPHRHHQMQEYYQSESRRGHLQVPIIREPQRPQRPTRADAQPSHERGRSAPPPIGENPWDVNVPLDPNQAAAVEIRRKPLPAPPSQFRLGEGGQPWSTWSMPVGYDPDTHPRDEDDDNDNERADARFALTTTSPSSPSGGGRNSTSYATNPTMVSTFSPEHAFSPEPTTPARARDLETGRDRELGALSAAMMTVDNGFENQWWYRDSTTTGTHATQSGMTFLDESPVNARWSAAPVTASTMATATATLGGRSPSASASTLTPVRGGGLPPSGVVSPMTEAAFSPAVVPAVVLQRSMSTRSEELWLREKSP